MLPSAGGTRSKKSNNLRERECEDSLGRCQRKILNTWSGHRTAQIDPEKCRKIYGTRDARRRRSMVAVSRWQMDPRRSASFWWSAVASRRAGLGGMSGSPILNCDGTAIGVVVTTESPHPRLDFNLPVWLSALTRRLNMREGPERRLISLVRCLGDRLRPSWCITGG